MEEFVAGGKARYVFRHFPVLGDEAVYAAVAVECAADQGAFWPLHDRFMAPDATLFTEAGMRRQIEFEGLDYEVFAECLRSGSTFPLVQAAYQDGVGRGVQGTPTVFVNGERVDPTFEAIADAINQALQ